VTWLLTQDGIWFNYINHNLQNPFFDLLMPLVSALGEGGLVWLFILFLLAIFGNGTGRKAAFLGTVALVASFFLLDEALKALVARPRPFLHFTDARLLVALPHSFSFPSGHASTSFATAAAIFLKHKRVGGCALVLAALIAFSRVYVGVHYPGDVLAGAVLGTVIALLVVSQEKALDKIVVRVKLIVRSKSEN